MILSWILSWIFQRPKKQFPSIPLDQLQGCWMVYYLNGKHGWTMLETQHWEILNHEITVTMIHEEIPNYSAPIVETLKGKIQNNRVCFGRRVQWIITEVTDHYLLLACPTKILFRRGQQQIWKPFVEQKNIKDFYLMDRG